MNDIEMINKVEKGGTLTTSMIDKWLVAYPEDYEILDVERGEFLKVARRLTYRHVQVDGLLKELLEHSNFAGAASYALNLLLLEGVNITSERDSLNCLYRFTPRAYRGTVATLYCKHICGPASGDLVSFKLRSIAERAVNRMFGKEDDNV